MSFRRLMLVGVLLSGFTFGYVLIISKTVDAIAKASKVSRENEVHFSHPSPVPSALNIEPSATPSSTIKSLRLIKPSKKEFENLDIPADQVIRLEGEMTDNVESIIQEIKQKQKARKDLYLLINSPGGSVFYGAKLVSVLETSPVAIHTICTGMCASMAFITLEYGTTRMAMKRSILMAHPASGQLAGNVHQMNTRLQFILRYADKLNETIAKRSGISLAEFNELMTNEYWLDGEGALNKHLIDKIVDFTVQGDQPMVLLPSEAGI